MNINALEDRHAVPMPRWVITFIITPLALFLYTFLYRKWITKNIKDCYYHPIFWIIGLFPIVNYQCLYQLESFFKQILIMTFIQVPAVESLSWAILLFMQPNMLLLLPYVCYKKGKVQTLLTMVKVVSILLSIDGFFYFLGISSISQGHTYLSCKIATTLSPRLYRPNFSLMWLFYAHLFQSHRAIYDFFIFGFQILCMYPITYVSQKMLKDHRQEFEPALLCILLFVIYFFNIQTTAGDMAFHMLMFISAQAYIRRTIVGAFVVFMAMVLLYFLSLAVSYEWGHSFTIPTSYVFFMLMPFWVSEVAIVTEMVSSTIKSQKVSIEAQKKPDDQRKVEENSSSIGQEKKD